MQTRTLEQTLELENPVVTVGTFDGVHRGHRAVIEAVIALARARSGSAVAVTFDPHPRAVIHPDDPPVVLTSMHEKRQRLEAAGIDVLAVIPFTRPVQMMSPEAFVSTYLVKYLDAKVVVLGYDHGFGKGRSGDPETMRTLGRRFGFDVTIVPPTMAGEGPVSSSRLRDMIRGGRIDEAREMLGGGYPVSGRVAHGDGRGRTLGYPTANIVTDDAMKLLPPDGVYAAKAFVPEPYAAVVNLGVRPTFNGKSRLFEAHLLDFSGDLYGRRVSLELVNRLRDERRFSSTEALISQIHKDGQRARDILGEEPVHHMEVRHWA
ncbi:MAG: bifunctional riboflavin kinase/FAD synthetase [Gemmatimonadota bacterium]|nr:bifunctional riboflavin kinase/FAD synthetase [Gemmatimonadota bacterium]